MSKDGLMPPHAGRMSQYRDRRRKCLGGNELPLEKDAQIAEAHFERLKLGLYKLSGSEKSPVARQLKTLAKRVELYRDYQQPDGIWQLRAAYYTNRNCAEEVESLTHEILKEHLDMQAPIGEVFRCSASEAAAAIESALTQLGMLDAAKKETRDDTTSAEYGECTMCGENLTKKGSCPDCAQFFRTD